MEIEQLFLLYYRPLCLYALHILGDVDRAEDVVQDCFVKTLEKPLLPADSSDYEALLFRMVRNRCIDELRRDNRQAEHISIDAATAQLSELTTPPSADDAWNEADAFEAARLWTAIDALPDRCREAFLLSKRDGMTYREIAEELGISERTVEHHISKALRILRSKASDFFRLLLGIA